jgi:hypothetical protein
MIYNVTVHELLNLWIMKYDVYFEIYGKKMRATVQAETMTEAKQKVTNKIIFHKIVDKEPTDMDNINNAMDEIMDILGAKKK